MNNINITVWIVNLIYLLCLIAIKTKLCYQYKKRHLINFLPLNAIDNSKSLQFEKYCLSNNGQEIGEDKISNIFKYVMPYSPVYQVAPLLRIELLD